MDSNELFTLAQKLSSKGMTDHLKNGMEAVSVSLKIPGVINEQSKENRKELLKKQFNEKLEDLMNNNNLEIDFNSISPTA